MTESQVVKAAQEPRAQITFVHIEDALKRVPVSRLPEVYAYLVELAEDAADTATLQAAVEEARASGEPGLPLDEYLRQQGLKDEVVAAHAFVQSTIVTPMNGA
jgi:hypothetical protein